MSTYLIHFNQHETLGADLLDVNFGAPANNDQIVKDAAFRLDELIDKVKILKGGKLVLINGRASLPVAVLIGHKVAHLYGAVGVFDPKLEGYVISISHTPDYPVGALVK